MWAVTSNKGVEDFTEKVGVKKPINYKEKAVPVNQDFSFLIV